MKTKSFSPMGALHPILFFAGVYVVALFFSIFICTTLFNAFNSGSKSTATEEELSKDLNTAFSANTVVMR